LADFGAEVLCMSSEPCFTEPLTKNDRDLAGHGAEAGAVLPQARVQSRDRLLGSEHALDQSSLLKESFAMRVPLVEPVGQKTPAHFRQAPKAAAVFEARHVVVRGVRPPDGRFGGKSRVVAHGFKIAARRALPKLRVRGPAAQGTRQSPSQVQIARRLAVSRRDNR
jgi:hypothetical protein